MLPLKTAGTVRLQDSDPDRAATALAHLFRGLGFEVKQDDAQLWLVNRHSTFLESHELAFIATAEVTLIADAGRTSAHYALTFPWTLLIPVALFPIGVGIVSWPDSVAFGIVALILGSGVCWLGIYSSKEGFEEWIQRVSWKAREAAGVQQAGVAAGVHDADDAAAVQVLQQHRRTTLRWQTALAAVVPLGFLLIASMFALQFRAEKLARGRFRDELTRLAAHSEVVINGRPLPQSDLFLQLLGSVRYMQAHHSGPVRQLPVTVRSGGREFRFVIGQDSERPDEFWVTQNAQEVGRVSDPRLRSIVSAVAPDIR